MMLHSVLSRSLCREYTTAMNVDAVYAPDLSTRYTLPVFLGRLPAGFPSPADDSIEGKLDLNRHLIKHPAATFFVRRVRLPLVTPAGLANRSGRSAADSGKRFRMGSAGTRLSNGPVPPNSGRSFNTSNCWSSTCTSRGIRFLRKRAPRRKSRSNGRSPRCRSWICRRGNGSKSPSACARASSLPTARHPRPTLPPCHHHEKSRQ